MLDGKRGQLEFSNFIMLIIFLAVVFISGILAAVVYYDLGVLDSTLHTVNFNIPIQDNSTVVNGTLTDFQDVLGIVVYPILGLRTSLPYLVYFMIFAFIMALGITAYVSAKNAVFFVAHILFTSLMTYFSLVLSNSYAELLTNPFFNAMMVDFTIYNKVMLYLPQIVFFTGLLFGVIAFVSLIKPNSNQAGNQIGLNYGGDY